MCSSSRQMTKYYELNWCSLLIKLHKIELVEAIVTIDKLCYLRKREDNLGKGQSKLNYCYRGLLHACYGLIFGFICNLCPKPHAIIIHKEIWQNDLDKIFIFLHCFIEWPIKESENVAFLSSATRLFFMWHVTLVIRSSSQDMSDNQLYADEDLPKERYPAATPFLLCLCILATK